MLGARPGVALVAGFGLALSSTAFVLPILGEKKQLATPYGQASFAILLFQDLAVIPLLVILPMLTPGAAPSGSGGMALLVGKILLALVGLVLAGRYLFRRLFKMIAQSGNQEILTAMALLIVVTHRVRMPQAQTNEPLQSLAHDTTQVIAVPSRPDAAATDPRPAPTPSQSPSSADEPTQAVPVGAGPSGTGDELTQALPTGSPDAEPTQAIPSGTAQTWNPDDTNPQGRLP